MSEADLIREGNRLALAKRQALPTIPIVGREGPHFAERVDEHLKGFGER